jgi:hypothetical protein
MNVCILNHIDLISFGVIVWPLRLAALVVGLFTRRATHLQSTIEATWGHPKPIPDSPALSGPCLGLSSVRAPPGGSQIDLKHRTEESL